MLLIQMTEKTFIKNNTVVSYTIKSRKGLRGVRIAVHTDQSVVVTKSKYLSESEVERLVQLKVDWILEKIDEMNKRPKKLLAHYSTKDFKEHKQNAYLLAHNRVLYFNKFYKHEVKSVTIRNQKTRWGSCSGKGNLNFNYKIVFLPEDLRDYIIVHELCHSKEMNHGKRFWALVSQTIPEYKQRINEIKAY